MITTVRVQEKGQVTIPRKIRKLLNLKKGDLVTFVTTDRGVVIKSIEAAAEDLYSTLGKQLSGRDINLDEVLAKSQHLSNKDLVKEFNLKTEDLQLLYQAAQFRALAAVEAIRELAEETGVYTLTEEDIDAEIEQARGESGDEYRS
jgi:AbrB family looped-hinge helix DNA binding protein